MNKKSFPAHTLFYCISFFTALFLSSCGTSSTSLYDFNYPLTGEKALAANSVFSVNVPEGWYKVDNNQNNALTLWLVKKDLSASMQIMPIIPDDKLNGQNNRTKLESLLDYSKIFKKEEVGKKFRTIGSDEYFELNNRPCTAYSFINKDNLQARIVIFNKDNAYYEFTASPSPKTDSTKYIPAELFSAQNSVLSSLK